MKPDCRGRGKWHICFCKRSLWWHLHKDMVAPHCLGCLKVDIWSLVRSPRNIIWSRLLIVVYNGIIVHISWSAQWYHRQRVMYGGRVCWALLGHAWLCCLLPAERRQINCYQINKHVCSTKTFNEYDSFLSWTFNILSLKVAIYSEVNLRRL